MKTVLLTVLLLIVSNIFITLACYGHLNLQQTCISSNWPLYLVVLLSWGIALIEYSFMVPANRIGFSGNGVPFSLVQLKVMQECITLVVFTILSMIAFKGTHIGWNHIVAFLLIVAAVSLVFMEPAK